MLDANVSPIRCALIALGSVAIATILRTLIYVIFHEQIPYTTFYPAVMLTGLCCGLTWALATTALSALAASFWLSPLGRPLITEANDLTGMALFLLVSSLISWLAARVREHRRELERAAEERQKLFAAEQVARKEAERANRAKDDFLAAVTHELRTPLSSIVGWVQLVRRNALAKDELQTAMESIERSAKIQAQLITDLVDLSRVRMGKLRLEAKPVCLSDILRSATQTVLPSAKARGIDLVVSIRQSIGPVLADTDRLHQIVWNLLTNAIKFTPTGGSVRVTANDNAGDAELVVADTGEGIDASFLPMVFDRFRQEASGPHKGGLGLGLAITKELVELHGGSIRAASDGKGRGTTFTVVLPKLRVAAVATEVEREVTLSSSQRNQALAGKRVLIVDDDIEARLLIERVLQTQGAETIVASCAIEAEKLLTTWHADVLISDLGMPETDGIELIRHIRQRESDGASIPAVALTAYASEQDRQRALESGFQIHLGKPVEPARLVDAIAELAEAR